jgi:hypothetical protein
VVATIRSEFLSTAPDRAGLAEAVDDSLVIEPLSRARLAEVIARPAQRAGLDLEPGLVERMVEDTAGGDALPLLGYTLHQLYQRTEPDGRAPAAPAADILKAPVSALQGVSEGDADLLKQAFNIKTVGDLGKNKYFRAAQLLAQLSEAGAK